MDLEPIAKRKRHSKKSESREARCIDLSNILRPFSSTSTLETRELEIGHFFIDYMNYIISSKFYHTKKQFVWEFCSRLEDELYFKIVIDYSDVDTLIFSTRFTIEGFCLVEMALTTNSPAKIYKQAPNPNYKHNKYWVESEDFTFGSASKPLQLHKLTFTQAEFLSKQGALSHFEKLLLGDPYLMHISYLNGNFPAVGEDVSIVGRRSWAEILDRMTLFLEIMRDHLESLEECVQLFGMHRFKWRVGVDTPEPAIAIHIEDVFNILEPKCIENMITKDEIQYFISIVKVGENGLSIFKDRQHLKKPPIKVAVLLSKERLVRICGQNITSLWQSIERISLRDSIHKT